MNEGSFSRFISRLTGSRRLAARIERFTVRYRKAVDVSAGVLSVSVYAASAAVLVLLLLYNGFDHDTIDKRLIVRLLYVCQGVFLTNIFFNIIFRPGHTLRQNRILRRIPDTIMILTLVPVLWPGGEPDPVTHFIRTRTFLYIGLTVYAIAELSFGMMQLPGKRTNPSLILSTSFLLFIIIGSLVLMLPKCTVGSIRYIDALFMASSAVSMTGLCTVDVSTTFTPMGWLAIAILMQTGALGVLTVTSFFALFFSGRGSIFNQLLMRDFIYSKSIGRLIPTMLYILVFSLSVEALGAIAIYFTIPEGFMPQMKDRIIFSAFHSLSAFCNGGFTTVPGGMANPGLMRGNQSIYLVMSVLILAGGIGFPNLVNFKDAAVEYFKRIRDRIMHRRRPRPVHVYDVNTKIVLIYTAVLFAAGAVMFFVLESGHSMAHLSMKDRIIQSVFCSVTVRTAGFDSFAPDSWLGVTLMLAMVLMWVGCASQSMGGGIKINAFAAVLLNLRSIVTGQKGVTAFRRTIEPEAIRRANGVVCFSIAAIFLYSCVLMLLEPDLPGSALAFEAFSSITTIGMSMGITPDLSDASKIVVATGMFLGRVGIISVLCGLVGNRPDRSGMYPPDDIIIN